MKLNVVSLLALVASCSAVSVQLIKNYCLEDVYLTLAVNATEDMNGPFTLPSGEAYISNITGTGNTAIVTKETDIFASAKLVLGTSTADEILYWSLSNITGDPMAGETYNVTSDGTAPDVCQNATTGNGAVHACSDQDVTLTLNLC